MIVKNTSGKSIVPEIAVRTDWLTSLCYTCFNIRMTRAHNYYSLRAIGVVWLVESSIQVQFTLITTKKKEEGHGGTAAPSATDLDSKLDDIRSYPYDLFAMILSTFASNAFLSLTCLYVCIPYWPITVSRRVGVRCAWISAKLQK